MKNLADKILNSLRNNKLVDDVLADVKNKMSKLSKNLTHPLIDNEGKNKLLEAYMSLSDVEKLLYRYNVLMKNNQIAAANEKKDELESMVLNGHISKSNVKYVWRSEFGEHTCDECESMDGQEYESEEDIPPQPHPNCKCYIEIDWDEYPEDYDDNGESEPQPKKKNEEPCDCWQLVEKYDELISKAEDLISEVKIRIEHLDILGFELQQMPDKYTDWVLDELRQLDSFLGDLAQNMYEGRQDTTVGADKYYHAKANCQVAQRRSEIETNLALSASFLRECEQWLWSIVTRQKTLENANKDFKEDTEANWKGYYEGRHNKDESCEDILKNMPHKE